MQDARTPDSEPEVDQSDDTELVSAIFNAWPQECNISVVIVFIRRLNHEGYTIRKDWE
jgi:hypothetical protein